MSDPIDEEVDLEEAEEDMDPASIPVPAGLPSANQLRHDQTKSGLPHPSCNLSRSSASCNLNRSAATSTQSLASTSSVSEHSSSANRSILSASGGVQRSVSSTDVLNSHAETLAVDDKVFVNGTKEGTIKFLGTTSFAPGKWAGVDMEEAAGKNDGSVNGVRYFECKQNHGIFVRPYRLTLEKLPDPPKSRTVSPSSSNLSVTTKTESTVTTTTTTSKLPPPKTTIAGTNKIGSLRVGMRVIVNASSGDKMGTVRYLGPADFATGAWAGIELDVAAGKNDGTVAGKRYFTCPMNYGLFAPINKVQRFTDIAASGMSTPARRLSTSASASSVNQIAFGRKTSVGGSGLPTSSGLFSSRKSGVSGSQESLSSVTSSFSTKSSSSRIKLGVTSLSGSKRMSSTSGKSLPGGVSSSSKEQQQGPLNGSSKTTVITGLSESISEKEEHISQLIRERDLERQELSRSLARIEDLESRLASLNNEHAKLITQKDEQLHQLQRSLSLEHLNQKELKEALDEEKRKLEVLEFRLEEEIVTKMELKEELDKISASTTTGPANTSSPHGSTATGRDSGMQSHREEDNEEEMFQLQEDLLRKDERIFELEKSLETRKTEVANLQKRVKEFENQVKGFDDRTKNYLTTIDDLNLKLKKTEDANRKFEEESSKHREIKRRLEDQVSDLISKTGDSTGQLLDLKDEIKAKSDENELLKNNVARLSKEVEVSREAFRRLENNLQAELREKERRIEDLLISEQHMSIEIDKREDIIKHLEDKIDDLVSSDGDNSDQLASLTAEVKTKSHDILRLEEEVIKLRTQIDQMDRSAEKTADDVALLKKTVASKEDQITEDRKVITELQDKHKFLEEQLATAKNRHEDDLKDKGREITMLQSRVEELLKASGDSGTQLAAINEQLVKKQKENNSLSDQLRSTWDSLTQKDKEMTTLNLQLDDSKKLLKKKDDKLTQVELSLAETQEELKRISEEKKKLGLHLDDMIRRQDESSKHLDKLNEESRDKQNNIKKLKEGLKDLKDQLQREEIEKKKLIIELTESRKTICDSDAKIDELSRKMMESESSFFREINDLKDAIAEAEVEKEKLKWEIKSLQSGVDSRERAIEKLKEQLENTRKEFDEYRKDLKMQLKQTQSEGDQISDHLRREINSIQEERDHLKQLNEQMRVKMERVLDEMENVQRRNTEVLDEFKAECDRLEDRVNEKNRIIADKESLIRDLEGDAADKLSVLRKRFENEKIGMIKKIDELEAALVVAQQQQQTKAGGITTKTSVAITSRNSSTQLTSSTTTSSLVRTNGAPPVIPTASDDEKEQYESQIEFLNSVIVDMQKKNDDLKSKLLIMEEFTGGSAGDVAAAFDAHAQSLNQQNYSTKGLNGHSRRPPRAFCDICDAFDLHETEECPRQSSGVIMAGEEQQPNCNPTRKVVSGKTNLERAYCASCEVFGHWTKDCDDNQSY
jgi:CAP-Gly domain-containing linker protein 1